MINYLIDTYSKFPELTLFEQFLLCFQGGMYLLTFFAFITVIHQAVLIVANLFSNAGNSAPKRKTRFLLWLTVYSALFLIISVMQRLIDPNILV